MAGFVGSYHHAAMQPKPPNTQKPTNTDDAFSSLERSELALRVLAMPAFANPHGDMFGGWLLSQMDLAGGAVATRLANGRVVTIAITGVTFKRPVFVGDEISCYADLVKIGRTSMTLKVRSVARRGHSGEQIEVTDGLLTYVAVDSTTKPRPIK
jgi:acyl-CoA thioesterase YciA